MAAQLQLLSEDALAVRREGAPVADVATLPVPMFVGREVRAEAVECGACHRTKLPYGWAGSPSLPVCLACTARIVTSRRREGLHVCAAYGWVNDDLADRLGVAP